MRPERTAAAPMAFAQSMSGQRQCRWRRPLRRPHGPRAGARLPFPVVGNRQLLDQFVQRSLDLPGIASHQNSVLQRIGTEGFDLLDVLIEDFDLFEARDRLAVGLPPHWRRFWKACVHHFFPVPPNMNLAINSVSEMASWVLVISPPGFKVLVSAPGSSTSTMPPSSDSLMILALVSSGSCTLEDTARCTTAW